MGWLGGNYIKEGKGVTKGAPEKNGFFMFFELVGRKIWELIKLNFLYFVTSIPYIIILFFASRYVVNFSELLDLPSMMPIKQATQLDGLLRVTTIVLMLVFWGAGPITAGWVYNLRNYAREEHTWMWSDFFEKTAENWKTSSIILILDIIVFVGGFTGTRFYLTMSFQSPFWVLPQVLLFLFVLVYTLMHTYIYQLMVTFQLSLGQIIKNAFLMTVAKFPMNLFLGMVVLAMTAGLMMGLGGLWLILVPIIYLSVCGFVLHFYATRMIKRYFIDPYAESPNLPESIFAEK